MMVAVGPAKTRRPNERAPAGGDMSPTPNSTGSWTERTFTSSVMAGTLTSVRSVTRIAVRW
jgi:hypothetical protein